MAGDLASTSADDNGGGGTGPTGNGATVIAGEGGWYRRVALAIANSMR